MKIQSTGHYKRRRSLPGTNRRRRARTRSLHSCRRGLEALEPRLLLSLDGPGYLSTDTAFNDHGPSYALVGDPQPEPAPDATPPEASLRVSDVTRFGGSRQLFRVKYTDDVAVDVSDIDDTDMRVIGPEGFDELATLVHVYGRGDGKSRRALYQIAAPGGTWDSADNGTYTIVMRTDQVSDTSDNFVAAGELGTFEVNVPEPPSEPGGNTTTAKGPHGPLSRAALDHLFKIGALG